MELGAVGSSIIANAGAGSDAFDEITLPVGPARVRVRTGASPAIDFTVNGYETMMLAHRLVQPGVRVDWNHSRRAGTFVLRTSRRLGAPGGWRAAAVTTGSVIVLSELASDLERSFDHERIHVQQEWFLQEILARPVESSLRARAPLLRAIPQWFEFGIVPPALLKLEGKTLGPSGPLRSSQESEAEAIEIIAR
jgi:hypothetical protein